MMEQKEQFILLQLYLNLRAQKFNHKQYIFLLILIFFEMFTLLLLIINRELFQMVYYALMIQFILAIYFLIGFLIFQLKGVDIIGITKVRQFKKANFFKKVTTTKAIKFGNDWDIALNGYTIYGNKKKINVKEILKIEVFQGYYVINAKPHALALINQNDVTEKLEKQFRLLSKKSIDEPLIVVDDKAIQNELVYMNQKEKSLDKLIRVMYELFQIFLFSSIISGGYIIFNLIRMYM